MQIKGVSVGFEDTVDHLVGHFRTQRVWKPPKNIYS